MQATSMLRPSPSAGRVPRSGRAVSGPASATGHSERSHRTLMDLNAAEREQLDETFALALQGRRTQRRRASSSSTEAPSAAELSSLLTGLKREERIRRQDGPSSSKWSEEDDVRAAAGNAVRATMQAQRAETSAKPLRSDTPARRSSPTGPSRRRRSSSTSSADEAASLSRPELTAANLSASLRIVEARRKKEHTRPPAPTRGRRSEPKPKTRARNPSPIPTAPARAPPPGDSSASAPASEAQTRQQGRSRRSPSPAAAPSIASAANIVRQAALSHAGSRRAPSRQASLQFDTDSADDEAYKTPSSSYFPQGYNLSRTASRREHEQKLISAADVVPRNFETRVSRQSSSAGHSLMSRPADASRIARSLQRIMALSSDDSDSASLSSTSQSWRPSPRAIGTGLGLRRWGYHKIAQHHTAMDDVLPAPVTMKAGYHSSPDALPTQSRSNDTYTAPSGRFPRVWLSSASDTDGPPTTTLARASTSRRHHKPSIYSRHDLEMGPTSRSAGQGHTRSNSLPLRHAPPRTDLPFHERPFPRPRRLTRPGGSSIGYFSDNASVRTRPPSAQAMLPPAGLRPASRRNSTAQPASNSQAFGTQSAPSSPARSIDHFAHMVLPPSFSPRPAEGIPPYFPLMQAPPKSAPNGWARLLSFGSPGSQMASDMAPGEVRRTARAEAAYRLGLGLSPSGSQEQPQSFADQQRTRTMSRKEAKLAALAAEASGNSAAARAYHMFAKKAYDKMAKTQSVPSQIQRAVGRYDGGETDKGNQTRKLPSSVSAPGGLAAAALANEKKAQLEKLLGKLASDFPDHTDTDDDALNATPELLQSGTPVPTDFPSDSDPNMSTPSEGASPNAGELVLAGAGIRSFRIIRPPAKDAIAPTLRLVSDEQEKEGAEGDKDEYARLLFDWDGMDEVPEDDDDLHDPQKSINHSWSPCRFVTNVGGLLLVVLALLGILAALPIISEAGVFYFEKPPPPPNTPNVSVSGVENLRWTIIDPDTPRSALHRMGGLDGNTRYNLVFSDEFNEDQRTFAPGMDPWWEAVDLWYWGTGDFERYHPNQVTTSGGALRIKLEERPLGGLNFRSGMLQSWNKLCMYGPIYMEVSVQLPGYANVSGLWPAVFTLGNLGRGGYGSTLEGMWPYSYNTCDVGTLANQTTTDGFPASAPTGGNTTFNRKHSTTAISYLPGQKLSACTCPQDDHPGPRLSGDDGQTYFVGRSVPEIDVIEGQVSWSGVSEVSQSVQMAPFNYLYRLSNSTGPAFTVFNNESHLNGYDGEVTQQSISWVTPTIQGAVEHPAPDAPIRAPPGAIQARPGYAVYAYEVEPGPYGYISWVAGGTPSFRMNAAAFDPDPISGIGRRVYSEEPMSIIMNLAISTAWSQPNWDGLTFPATMSVDYVRIYAPETADPALAISCDPPGAPTSDYINRHAEAYSNPNMTVWGGTTEGGGYEQYWPRNSLQPEGCRAPRSRTPGSPVDPLPKAPYVDPSEIGPG